MTARRHEKVFVQGKYKILFVDDESETRNSVSNALSVDHEVAEAADGQEAVERALDFSPDLIILDIHMPGRDGLWACRELREDNRTKHIPILILSARKELEQKLQAYEVGADDYLEKPFTMQELQAKIMVKLRRLDEKTSGRISRGNLILKPEQMEAFISGRRAALSVLECRLLAYFLRNADRVLSRKEILDNVWRGVNVSDRTVDAHIVSLRRKIMDFDHEISTIYGAGYSVRPRT